MRRLTDTDKDGRKFLVELPDDAPDSHVKMGVKIGPPDLSPLNLPKRTEVRLNNQLFDRGLFNKADLAFRRQELFAALQVAFSVDVNILDTLYEGVPLNGEVVAS